MSDQPGPGAHRSWIWAGLWPRRAGLLGLLLTLISAPLPARAETTAAALLIDNVRLIDFAGDAPRIRTDMAVLIEGRRIAQIAPSGSLPLPPGARRIDGKGRSMIPGLVDMHVHLWDEAALGAYLAHGITTIRNLSGMPFHLALADRIERGALLAPRLLTSGPILNSPGPNAQVNHQFVTTADEARAAVQAQHAAGFRTIKVYSNLTRQAYDAIRDEAAQLDMTLVGHSPEGVREAGMPGDKPFKIAFEELLDDGLAPFEHVETILWHGLRNRQDEDAARALARRLAASGSAVDPTLLAFYNLMRMAETKGAYRNRPGAELLNPLITATEQANYERWAGEAVAPAQATFAFLQRMTLIFAQEGVRLVTGDDAGIFTNPPGLSLADELRLLLEAGLTPHQVLQAATYNAAVVLNEAESAGQIAPGQRADLVLLDEDPLVDPVAATRPSLVIAAGQPADKAALTALLEQARQPDPARTQANIIAGLRAQGASDDVIEALQ